MVSKTSLLPLVKAHDWRAVDAGLTEKPSLIQYRDEQNRTWLHWAARARPVNVEDSIRTADVLIAKGLGFDESAGVEEGFHASPLWHSIAFAQNLPLAEHLLKMGARVHGLYAAAWNDDADAIDLLVRYGADIEGGSERDTPFLAAVGWERPAAIRALARHGADVDARDSLGRTGLHLLLERGKPASQIEDLIALGAGLDIPGRDGRTAREIMRRKKDPRFRDLSRRPG